MPELRGSFRNFPEAVTYFRQKVNLPTYRWDDLQHGAHTRAFVVAGVTRDAVLTDIRTAVDAAISQGETLADFRARFGDIIARHGWPGGAGNESDARRAWRTSTIYHTNLRTAYQAGRWETLKHFPYLQYQHNSIRNPREAHKAWHGKIIAIGDPWLKTHYTPNGWGCQCTMFGVSEARLRALGKTGPDAAPAPVAGDPPPEWAYHVGESSSGKLLSEEDMQSWRDQKGEQWEVLTPKTAAEYGRPDAVPLDPLPRPLAPVRRAEGDALHSMLVDALGGEEQIFKLQVNPEFSQSIVANARVLADHIDPARATMVPLLTDVLQQPFEVWQSFEKHKGTGRVVLRTRYIRAFDLPGQPGMLAVVEALKGQLVGWTLVPTKLGYLNRQRYGALLYARADKNGT